MTDRPELTDPHPYDDLSAVHHGDLPVVHHGPGERPRTYHLSLAGTEITVTGRDADRWADWIVAQYQKIAVPDADRKLRD